MDTQLEGRLADTLNYWGSTNKVEWHDTKVDFTFAHGFSLVYKPDNRNTTPPPERIIESWRAQIPAPVPLSQPSSEPSSRPSSGGSLQSFQSDSTSLQSAVVLNQSEIAQYLILKVPYDMVLCLDYLRDYSKLDGSFLKVMDWMDENDMGALKHKVTAFLCMIYYQKKTMTSSPFRNPWWEYIDWLPVLPEDEASGIPAPLTCPTVWPEDLQKYLIGTSLQIPLGGKLRSLNAKLKSFQEFAASEPDLAWAREIHPRQWIRFDACFHSRSMATPHHTGTAMVPCLDMANHSWHPNARYTQDENNGDMVLLKHHSLVHGDEITINYSPDHGAAECLMSYGFIDSDLTINEHLTLIFSRPMSVNNESWMDKVLAFRHVGLVHQVFIRQNDEEEIAWQSPFAYLLALDKEDGLVIEPDGHVHLRGQEITDQLEELEKIVVNHPNCRTIAGRAMGFVMDRVRLQMTTLCAMAPTITKELAESDSRIAMAKKLRELEMLNLVAVMKQISDEMIDLMIEGVESLPVCAPKDD